MIAERIGRWTRGEGRGRRDEGGEWKASDARRSSRKCCECECVLAVRATRRGVGIFGGARCWGQWVGSMELRLRRATVLRAEMVG